MAKQERPNRVKQVALDLPLSEDQIRDKELAFAREFSMDWNKTQAAIRAGYSEESARYIGYELLKKPHILSFVKSIQMERAKRFEFDIDWVKDQFFDCYMAAREKGDERTAVKALANLAKILGAYEKHNAQTVPQTQAEIDALKERLRARGVNLDVINARSSN